MKSLAKTCSLLYLFTFTAISLWSEYYYWWVGIFIMGLIFIIFENILYKQNQLAWRFFSLPVLLIATSWFFLLFWPASSWHFVYLVINTFLLYNSILLLDSAQSYHQFYSSLFLYIIFLLLATLYKIHIIWSVEILYLALVMLSVTVWASHNLLLLTKDISRGKIMAAALVMGLIALELFWIGSLFPTQFYVNATMVALLLFAAMSILRQYLGETVINHKHIITKLSVSLIGIVLILITAQWL